MRLRGIPPAGPVFCYVGSPEGTVVGPKKTQSTIRFPTTISKITTT